MSANRMAKEDVTKETQIAKKREEQRRIKQLEKQKVQKLKELVARKKAKEEYDAHVISKKITSGGAYSIQLD